MLIELINDEYHIHIDKGVLVLSKDEFISALRRGKGALRRASKAPRHAAMRERAEVQRDQRLKG